MKILFDNQIFNAQKYGGISRYFTELFKYFNNFNDVEYELPIRDSNNEYLKTIKPFSEMNLYKDGLLKNFNFRLSYLLNKIVDLFDKDSTINIVKRKLKEQNFDIFHPTYYSSYFLKYLKNKPLVLTVHDMIHEIYPQYFKRDFGRTIRNKRKLIKRADVIIAISENTKKDIIKFYNVPEDKIKVIYHGNSLLPVKNKPISTPELPQRYILFVGARGLYKNFNFFIESISPILNKNKDIYVVVAGGYSGKNIFSKEEHKLFRKLNIKNQIIHYTVDDNVLAFLYQNAICFVFPTLYEGFGIPLLEAFSCGCPAVVSNTSSLPEIGGNAALYFNPYNSEDILNSVSLIINNKNLRRDLIEKGKEQLKKFSWEKTFKETLDVYYKILENI